MCLITNLKKPLVAKQDIVVYKELTVDEEGRIFTPFQHKEVRSSELIIYIYDNKVSRKDYNGLTSISEGFIHAYTNPPETFYKICIIPKGTLYFVSSDLQEVCSKHIVFIDEIEKVINIDLIISDIDNRKSLKYNLPLNIIKADYYTSKFYAESNNCRLFTLQELREIREHLIYYNIKRFEDSLNLMELCKCYWSSEIQKDSCGDASIDCLGFGNGYCPQGYFDDYCYALAGSAF